MSQVVVGQLRDIGSVDSPEGDVSLKGWNQRAMWSYLRLLHGRKIDGEIKGMVVQRFGEGSDETPIKRGYMRKIFPDMLEKPSEPRNIQFILNNEGRVIAVASTKHLLVPPERIYEVADQIIGSDHKKMVVKQLQGECYLIKDMLEYNMKMGLQVHGGAITTRQAISVAPMFRIDDCLNPLSWLGVGGFGNLGGFGNYKANRKLRDIERVLRIQNISELEPRLKLAIEEVLGSQKNMELKILETKNIPISVDTAKILATALGLSYSLGAKTIKQVIDQFTSEEKHTQWGLAMASSYVAAHGNFKATPVGRGRTVEQSLSTISGVSLMLDDIRSAESKCLEWLQGKVAQGKIKKVNELIDEALGNAKGEEEE